MVEVSHQISGAKQYGFFSIQRIVLFSFVILALFMVIMGGGIMRQVYAEYRQIDYYLSLSSVVYRIRNFEDRFFKELHVMVSKNFELYSEVEKKDLLEQRGHLKRMLVDIIDDLDRLSVYDGNVTGSRSIKFHYAKLMDFYDRIEKGEYISSDQMLSAFNQILISLNTSVGELYLVDSLEGMLYSQHVVLEQAIFELYKATSEQGIILSMLVQGKEDFDNEAVQNKILLISGRQENARNEIARYMEHMRDNDDVFENKEAIFVSLINELEKIEISLEVLNDIRRQLYVSQLSDKKFNVNAQDILETVTFLLDGIRKFEISMRKPERVIIDYYYDKMIFRMVTTFLLGMTVLVVLLVVIYVLKRRVLEPVRLLTASMSRLADGEVNLVIPEVHYNDEIGEMIKFMKVFRSNAQGIKEAEVEIKRHSDHLESVVDKQTEQIKYESALTMLLLNIATEANQTQCEVDVYQDVLDLICHFFEWPIGHAFFYDPVSERLKSSNIWYCEDKLKYKDFIAATENLELVKGEGLPGQVAKSGEPLWIKDLTENHESPRHKAFEAVNIKSGLLFPVIVDDNVLAVVEFFTHQRIELKDEILYVMSNIGVQVGAVAKRERYEKKLINAKADAEKANHLKTEFLANMSHELRTPMHSILSFSKQGMKRIDKWSKEEQIKNLELINTSGDRLLGLLNNLLNLSKLESGVEEFNITSYNIKTIVEDVIKQHKAALDEKELYLEYSAGEKEIMIECDGSKINQAVSSLLLNAIQFTDKGKSISIDVLVCEDRKTVAIEIADEGVGIPEEELGTIFDKFIQSSNTKTGAGGVGLGLAISKEIVSKHNGSIHVSNNNSGGATFTIKLPFLQPRQVEG